jgi:hypothetical protein
MSEFNESEKERDKGLIKSLRSGNQTAILSALKDIRVSGKLFFLTEIFDLLLVQEDEAIYLEAVSLLNDLKNKEAVPIIAEAIRNPEYESIRQELVASCWQSGLSYSKHIETFFDVATQGNYAIALEAFTVIEDSIGDLDPKELSKHIDKLKKDILTADTNKQMLLRELIRVMETYNR